MFNFNDNIFSYIKKDVYYMTTVNNKYELKLDQTKKYCLQRRLVLSALLMLITL